MGGRVERLRQQSRQHRPERRRQVRQRRQLGLQSQRQLVLRRGRSHRARMVAARLRCVAGDCPIPTPAGILDVPLARPLAPDDLYRLRVPTDPRLAPDGSAAAVTVQSAAPTRDGEEEPRQLTLGAKHDRAARFSPDGRSVAFLSDRRLIVEEEPDLPEDARDREDANQVHLLPLDGGEARRVTNLPRGVEHFEWSQDGSRLLVTTTSQAPTRKEDRKARGLEAKRDPADPPPSDYHYVDRLGYLYNGRGF